MIDATTISFRPHAMIGDEYVLAVLLAQPGGGSWRVVVRKHLPAVDVALGGGATMYLRQKTEELALLSGRGSHPARWMELQGIAMRFGPTSRLETADLDVAASWAGALLDRAVAPATGKRGERPPPTPTREALARSWVEGRAWGARIKGRFAPDKSTDVWFADHPLPSTWGHALGQGGLLLIEPLHVDLRSATHSAGDVAGKLARYQSAMHQWHNRYPLRIVTLVLGSSPITRAECLHVLKDFRRDVFDLSTPAAETSIRDAVFRVDPPLVVAEAK